jgi:hypothetical protein
VTLSDKQKTFARLVGLLLSDIYASGHGVTFGEAYRSPEEAARLAAAGKGIVNSLHCQRLAIDLNLFRGDDYVVDPEAYRPFGEHWETLHPLARWGGRFADANHFSLMHEGRM